MAARVAFIVLDALPNRCVDPAVTPNLWALAATGGRAPEGATSVLSSNTYPNHASFVTGDDPSVHGLALNSVVRAGGDVVAAHVAGPATPTWFDRAGSGVRTALVVGDHHLVGVMGGERADHCWPDGGELAPETPRSRFGYATDDAVVDAVASLLADHRPDLLVAQLDESDTAAHLWGPDADRTLAQYTATDAALGRILGLLEPDWDDTVIIVVSDHEQEWIDLEAPPVLLADAFAHDDRVIVVEEGASALVVARDPDPEPPTGGAGLSDLEDAILAVDGVSGIVPTPGGWLVWSAPGRPFGENVWGLRGMHGSPRTATQVAVVGGGHPEVAVLAAGFAQRRPHATDWAPIVERLVSRSAS